MSSEGEGMRELKALIDTELIAENLRQEGEIEDLERDVGALRRECAELTAEVKYLRKVAEQVKALGVRLAGEAEDG